MAEMEKTKCRMAMEAAEAAQHGMAHGSAGKAADGAHGGAADGGWGRSARTGGWRRRGGDDGDGRQTRHRSRRVWLTSPSAADSSAPAAGCCGREGCWPA
ncbi:hypothetical protein OsI_06767 [Oryza sativa Indica Group]|uniref:Uncharacterized protein n=1 Tax=Oryza sativa subsp. indica TaxID=39946 RepID=B8AFM6_ORYSI|nr:hypothetical protein OsI_06767 [Oryza sativa Indica Group]